MQEKQNIEITREEARLSLEELEAQSRAQLLPDRIELHRRHGRRRRGHGGVHSVNISGGYGGGSSGSGGPVSF
jgi:hypothetical protein